MEVSENPGFTRDYLDPAKRSIGNSVQVFFRDGSSTRRVSVDYPVGHRRRRKEGVPLLHAKFEAAVRGHFDEAKAAQILLQFSEPASLDAMTVTKLMGMLVP
jgi:2-methylcitrate dehydratase